MLESWKKFDRPLPLPQIATWIRRWLAACEEILASFIIAETWISGVESTGAKSKQLLVIRFLPAAVWLATAHKTKR
jgi:hypothetical protein